MIPKPRIYISVPLDGALQNWQSEVKTKLLEAISEAGFEPQEFGVSGLPAAIRWNFDAADQIMQRCRGAIILAFIRHEFRTEHYIDGQMQEQIVAMPTEYNHYEGALAITKGLPTLIIADKGVRSAGIVDQGGKFINYIPRIGALEWLQSAAFKTQFDAWRQSVKNRSDVFFGYCSKAQPTADAIIKYLIKSLNVSVTDWAIDFNTGSTIMAEIRKAIQSCQCGILLFTSDDPLAGDAQYASPRDNVIFEAGFCMSAKGEERTLIIREEGAKMPADLGGSIYIPLKNRSDISTIETRLRSFLETRL